ncbi:MAG TPA: ATP-binding protein [Burkholderiaceae bacterium]|nr:ATP-binding protein [Burkholderiaceae bacterium]
MLTLATLTLTPGPDTVAQALTWLEQVAWGRHWPQRTVFALQLCLDEALTNTVMHGFANAAIPSPRIALSLHADNQVLALDITDNGPAFDPTRRQPADLATSLDKATPGGHGIRLMQHYLHDFQYTYANGENHVRMVVLLNPQKP